jgi:hypothetical protein
VLRLIIGHGGRIVLSGVVAGLLTAVLLTRLVAGLLFGVAAIDRSPSGSVWVQFSDPRSRGSRVYALRSTSGLLVNLEPCNGCGVSDWGWQKGASWLRQATSVTFAASGRHIIRVQVREDGAPIDQIVLSPSRYLRTPPGTARVDTTIVDKP